MKNIEPIYTHYGSFNETAFNQCVSFHKNYFFKHAISSKLTKNSIYVIIESFHNVLKHSKEVSHFKKTVLKTYHLKNVIVITTSNIINDGSKNKLKELLTEFKKKTIEELKVYYKQTILDPTDSKLGDSNLGIALMLINSNKNFKYRFIPVSEKKFKFNLQITIQLH